MTAIFRNKLASCGAAICLFAAMTAQPAQAQLPGQQIPQVSLLPTVAQVPPGQALPIDGVWMVRENGKRVSIDHGRSIDIDPWVHMVVFKVDPGRVTMRDIHPDGSGGYTGYDLVLLQQVDMHVEQDGSITAHGSGIAPATYHLDRVSQAAVGAPAAPPAYAPPAGAPPTYAPPAGAPPADAPPSADTPPSQNGTVDPWDN